MEFKDSAAARIYDMSKKHHELTGQDHAHPDGPGKDKKNPRTYLNDAERMLEKYK